VCAAHLERARSAAEQWPGTTGYDDVRRLLAEERVDGAVVCLPIDAYVDVVRPLLDARVPVLVEKPGAPTRSDLTRLADRAAGNRTPLLVGYMKRYAPAYVAARARVAEPEFGRVSSVHARFTLGPGFSDTREWVVDNLVHPLDLLRWFGGNVVDVSAQHRGVDQGRQALALCLRHDSGAVSTAQLTTTGSWAGLAERLEVFGEGESVTVTGVDTLELGHADGSTTVRRPSYPVPLPENTTPVTTGFRPELAHFRDVIVEQAGPRTPATDAAETLGLAERVLAQILA
jgi:predicted dehydrogenase